MLDVRRLRVLQEVVTHGSFSAAAESLHLSQSAVSQQIAVLETEAGIPLLQRTSVGPKLTAAAGAGIAGVLGGGGAVGTFKALFLLCGATAVTAGVCGGVAGLRRRLGCEVPVAGQDLDAQGARRRRLRVGVTNTRSLAAARRNQLG